MKNESMLTNPVQMHAIFVLHDPVYWEDALQIMCDLWSSEDGRIIRKYFPVNHSKHIPIFTVNNDILYADEFPRPRFAYGPFTIAFRSIFHQLYNRYPSIVEYGKPTLNTYTYAGKKRWKQEFIQ